MGFFKLPFLKSVLLWLSLLCTDLLQFANGWLLSSFTWVMLHDITVLIQSILKTPVGAQTASKSVWRLRSGGCWLIFKLCVSLQGSASSKLFLENFKHIFLRKVFLHLFLLFQVGSEFNSSRMLSCFHLKIVCLHFLSIRPKEAAVLFSHLIILFFLRGQQQCQAVKIHSSACIWPLRKVTRSFAGSVKTDSGSVMWLNLLTSCWAV